MYKRQRDSGGGDNESFDPMAFYREQQQAMLIATWRLILLMRKLQSFIVIFIIRLKPGLKQSS